MRISLIVAVAANGVIGRGDELPWHLPADLKRFRQLTMGHSLIVGRRTWESIGRPLPGRRMIVVSRSQPELPDGVAAVSSIEEALDLSRQAGDDEAFIAGGAQIYALALPLTDRVYWTEVHADIEGDVDFPPWDRAAWVESSRETGTVDEASSLDHSFVVYDRLAN